MWLYTPVCIRLSDSVRVSGIHVVNVDESVVFSSFCLTVCHVPLPLPRIHVAAPQLHHDIVWHEALVTTAAPAFLPSDPLYSYLSDALAHGFNLFPLDTSPTATLRQVQVLKLQCSGIYTPETAWAFSPLRLGSISAPAPLTVRSTPFSFTAPVAFADFLSSGYINCVLRDSTISGYLSDLKYLENMVGGIANSVDHSIGLVVGNLRKKNGDGDLVVVCSWHQLWRQLGDIEDAPLPPLDAPLQSKSESAAPFDPKQASSTLSEGSNVIPAPAMAGPVLPLAVYLDHGASWGSCVLLDESTIVTNVHVLQPWLDSKDGECSILLREQVVRFGPDDRVVVPYNNLDLAFVKLSLQTQVHLSAVKTATIGEAKTEKGDLVRAVGYGLFVNKRQLEPLISEGHISAVVKTCPFPNSDKMSCMLVASSSCWNGSSGGGLFDSSGNLVGILCSNAQVFVPRVGEEQITEKVPSFALCIPIELVSACYERKLGNNMLQDESNLLPLEVEHMWQLKSTHRDRYQRSIKL